MKTHHVICAQAVLTRVCASAAVFVCSQCLWTLISSYLCDMFALFHPSSSFSWARKSVSVSIPAALRGRSFSHLSPPRISQSEVTASSVPPPLPPPLILFSHPHSMSSLASPPTASRRTSTSADTHQLPPPIPADRC